MEEVMAELTDKMVYLDYNATTPLEPQVISSIQSALSDAWANPSSCHDAGMKAKEVIKKARQSVADMVNGCPQDVIFTSGGTEANNMILHTGVKHFWHSFPAAQKISAPTYGSETVSQKAKLPHFVTTNVEHDAIKLVLEAFQKQHLAEATFVPVNVKTGKVEVEDIIGALRPTTCMVSVMLANNETGIMQPVAEISERIHKIKRNPEQECRILIHTDAAQALGKIPVDIHDLGVDYLTIVGHKFYGPRIGAIYTRELSVRNPLYPMFYGGGQEHNYRPGTENTAMIAGLGQACQLVADNVSRYQQHMENVRDYLETQLKNLSHQVVINCDYTGSKRLPNTCNMSFLGLEFQGNKVLSHLRHTQASVGAACHSSTESRASPILLASGVTHEVAVNALRLSVGRHTTTADIDIVLQDLNQAVTILFSNR